MKQDFSHGKWLNPPKLLKITEDSVTTTTDISNTNVIWYRLSRRGADFLLQSSLD